MIDAHRTGWMSRLAEAFSRRELLFMLVRRDISVRYREAVLGVAWAVLIPAATLGVYWFVFDMVFERQAVDAPYVVFLFPAMLVWNYFNSSVGRASHSLAKDAMLLSKVYFPRILLPVSNVISPLLDMAIGMIVLVFILLVYKYVPGVQLVWVPVFVLMGMAAATGVGMLMAALNAQFKDVQHFLPVLLHLWFFGSPILYPTSRVPERFQLLYSLNPMVTVCEGTRFAVLGTAWPLSTPMVLAGVGTTLVLLVLGFVAFMRTEQTITDTL
ncbi:MAG: ABC transporter permease [Planctomycetota bacterium]